MPYAIAETQCKRAFKCFLGLFMLCQNRNYNLRFWSVPKDFSETNIEEGFRKLLQHDFNAEGDFLDIDQIYSTNSRFAAKNKLQHDILVKFTDKRIRDFIWNKQRVFPLKIHKTKIQISQDFPPILILKRFWFFLKTDLTKGRNKIPLEKLHKKCSYQKTEELYPCLFKLLNLLKNYHKTPMN